jgi:hypothetical protein
LSTTLDSPTHRFLFGFIVSACVDSSSPIDQIMRSNGDGKWNERKTNYGGDRLVTLFCSKAQAVVQRLRLVVILLWDQAGF